MYVTFEHYVNQVEKHMTEIQCNTIPWHTLSRISHIKCLNHPKWLTETFFLTDYLFVLSECVELFVAQTAYIPFYVNLSKNGGDKIMFQFTVYAH